ncbi:MAG: hypothetical protein O7G88_13685 [bacterium]|nr:hypothetical protein [bacterium]
MTKDVRQHLATALDTGADFSVAPRRLALQLGLERATLPETHVVGVEQGGVRARLGQLPLRLMSRALTMRCLFVDAARAPYGQMLLPYQPVTVFQKRTDSPPEALNEARLFRSYFICL